MEDRDRLGTTWSHSDRFSYFRRQHLAKVTPIRTRVIADFELISHRNAHETVAKIDLSGVDTSAVKDCQHCGNKFGFFEKKHVCGICKRVVCVDDTRLQQLVPPATASMAICRKCYTFIKFHFHQAELKRRIAEAANNIAVIFYSTLMAIKDEIVHELPKFRGVVFSLSTLFGDSPQQQDKIREGIDDGAHLPFPGRTLEELFTQGMNSQKRLKNVFAALEERLQGIQAASNDTKTQQKMISLLKQAMADFLTSSLPLFRFSSQRLAEIKDHPKTRRLLLEAKEQIKQEALEAARREQEEADRLRYQAIMGDASPTIVSASESRIGHEGDHHQHGSFTDKLVARVQKAGHSAYHSLSKQIENLNESHFVPEIAGIVPAICPTLGGVPLAIRGRNFHQNVRVYVAGKKLDEWQVLWKSPTELMIISPQLSEEGPVDLEVENPNQHTRGILEGVLFCTNDPTIIETFFGSSATTNSSTSKPAASSNTAPINPGTAMPATSTSPSQTNNGPSVTTNPHVSQPWGQPAGSQHPSISTSPSRSIGPSSSSSQLATSPTKVSPLEGSSYARRTSLVDQHELPPGYAAAIAPSPFHLASAHSEPVVGLPPSYATLNQPLQSTSQTSISHSTSAAPVDIATMKVSRTFGSRN